MSDDIEFDPRIPATQLPTGWTIESRYETSVYLQSPEGQPEHVILQYWAEEGDDPEYLVEPMIATETPGMSAQNNPSKSRTFSDIDDAVDYAVGVANDIAQAEN